MNIENAVKEFFDYLSSIGRSEATVKTYGKFLWRYHAYLASKYNRMVFTDDINSDDFEKYLANEGTSLSRQSKRIQVIAFKSFTKFLSEKGYSENIGKEIGSIQPRVKEKTCLTEDEFIALAECIDDTVCRIVVYTMYYTGGRINEMVRLTLEDVDLIHNLIYIRKPKGHIHKDRVIPINYKLRSLLLEYLSIRLGGNTVDSFFVLKRSGRISDTTINRAIHRAAEKAGIERNISCHTLRHTFSTGLHERSVDLVRIKELLGHSSLNVTDIYLHSSDKNLRKAVNMMK